MINEILKIVPLDVETSTELDAMQTAMQVAWRTYDTASDAYSIRLNELAKQHTGIDQTYQFLRHNAHKDGFLVIGR